MKLPEIILLAISAGLLVIWIAEYQRTNWASSYWLLMFFLGFLLAFQYVRNKRIEAQKATSSGPTKRAENQRKKK